MAVHSESACAAASRPFVLGLTGGVASGKTAVSDLLRQWGAAVVDTDVIARDIVAPGRPALQEIVARWGEDMLDATGALNRRRLRERIFADAAARTELNAITHPRIRAEAQRQVETAAAPYVVLVVPLMAEGGVYTFVDRVLVVDVSPEVQVQRLMARDGVDLALAHAMLAAQASREARLALADDVVRNDADLATLAARLRPLHEKFLQLAAERRAGQSGH